MKKTLKVEATSFGEAVALACTRLVDNGWWPQQPAKVEAVQEDANRWFMRMGRLVTVFEVTVSEA